MLPEGRIKDEITLFFFKLLINKHLQLVTSQENFTLGYCFVDNMYNFFAGS